ncbi:MAG: type II toxin-antitoxin system RelE/ParE family toxin [Clostridiales bacterium]|nr:type II toxin-antitoxin system RelE/ParE family toxin [Clostridiales bacterium]
MILRYTPAARADLADTRDYIENTLKNPGAAQNVTMQILKHCSILKEQPFCGGDLAAKTGRDTDMRFLVCGKHIAFYRVQDETISVIRILDGRTNYMRELFGIE